MIFDLRVAEMPPAFFHFQQFLQHDEIVRCSDGAAGSSRGLGCYPNKRK